MRGSKFRRRLTIAAILVLAFLVTAAIIGSRGDGESLGPAVLIDTDFGASAEPIFNVVFGKPSETFTGVIAKGWGENSSNWAEVRCDCSVLDEKDQKFLAWPSPSVSRAGRNSNMSWTTSPGWAAIASR